MRLNITQDYYLALSYCFDISGGPAARPFTRHHASDSKTGTHILSLWQDLTLMVSPSRLHVYGPISEDYMYITVHFGAYCFGLAHPLHLNCQNFN